MKSLAAACAAALLGFAALTATADAITLKPGKAKFWDGPFIKKGCDGACPSWPLEVPAGAARLRVAIDIPMRDDTFELKLTDPSGKLVDSGTTSNLFNVELLAPKPAAGKWTVSVVPKSVTDSPFRLRAKLEKVVPQLTKAHVPILPNLKAIPPLELGFIAPLNPLNGVYPPDTINPPLDIGGFHPLSCAADEMLPPPIGSSAKRCLRLTSGPMNVGKGPFEMRFQFVADVLKGMSPLAHGPIAQQIVMGDGGRVAHPAGTYSFHVTHAHFHDDDILTYELFKVSGAGPDLVKVSQGVKSGFCPANQLMGDWKAVANAEPDAVIGTGDVGVGNCQDFANGVLGLSPGWGDVYRWQRPGQFVPFDDQSDGRYVVRSTVDALDHILETRDDDNSAYAYVEIKGDAVKVLQRGQGLSPWDPKKVLFKGKGPASRD